MRISIFLNKNTEKTLLHPFTTRLQTLGISVPIQNPEASASYRNKAIRNLLHSAGTRRPRAPPPSPWAPVCFRDWRASPEATLSCPR